MLGLNRVDARRPAFSTRLSHIGTLADRPAAAGESRITAETGDRMANRIPLLNAQLAFGLQAERSGRRSTVTLMFRTPPAGLSTSDVQQVVQSLLLRTPALSYRIRFSRGGAYQERHAAECDFAELTVAGGEAVSAGVTEQIEAFEVSLDGAAMAARLLRSPEADTLLLIFDHALVDEHSMVLIRRQLAAPSTPDAGQHARYQAAVHDRMAAEAAAAAGPGVAFWRERLDAAGEFPRLRPKPTRVVPIEKIPGVAIPRSFRGSLFPYVLFSIHRALRDVSQPGPTVIGYPWGGRNPAYTDVVGCFMNTVISLGPTGARQAPADAAEFLRGWYGELDHADVPFSTVVGLRSAFSGAVTAQLSYQRATERTVVIAGVPAVETAPSRGRGPQGPVVLAGATLHDEELGLRLLIDEQSAGYGAQAFGARWRHWLTTALSRSPERTS
ncbi:hypothetical protein [Streptomyces sp. CA2R106]|uniref:hypothetical protein n=1 Tax=Streptomyces sp. CA2R106 TaxID=3120153 RepID=UPI00300B60AF